MDRQRVVCGLCYQRYGPDRQAKLLVCSHCFCLQCLETLEKDAIQNMKFTVQSSGNTCVQKLTFACPVCQKTIRVPAGGVVQLQSAFYSGEIKCNSMSQPVLCDLCDEGQEAAHACEDCQKNFCSQCDRIHSKCKMSSSHQVQRLNSRNLAETKGDIDHELQARIDEQVKVLEAALTRMGEEDSKIERQRRTIATEMQARFNILMTDARQVLEVCEQSLDEAARTAQEKLKAEMTKARQAHEVLFHLTLQNSATTPDSVSKTDMPSLLLSSEDLQMYRQRAACKGKESQLIIYQAKHDAITFNSLQAYIGAVNSGNKTEECGRECINDNKETNTTEMEQCRMAADDDEFLRSTSINPEWKERLVELESKTADLKKKYTAQEKTIPQILQDLIVLQAENSKLCLEMMSLKDENSKLNASIKDLLMDRQNVGDNSHLRQDIVTVKDQVSNLTVDLSTLQKVSTKLEDEMKAVMKESSAVKTGIASLGADVSKLHREGIATKSEIAALKIDNSMHSQEGIKVKNDITALQEANSSIRKENSEMKAEITSLKSDHSRLQTDMTSIKEDNAKLWGDVTVLQRDDSALQKEVNCVKGENTDLKHDITVLKQDNKKLHQENSSLKSELEELQGETQHVHDSLSAVKEGITTSAALHAWLH